MPGCLFYLVFVVLCLTVTPPVFADSVATPCSYKVDSGNKEYFAVILALPEATKYECISQGPEKKNEALELRRRFPMSGVYASSSQNPLWQFDWYSHEVLLANDGRHLIRKGPWASKETDEAVSFFVDGRTIKSYAVQDLIKNMDVLPRSVSHFRWSNGFSLNDFEKSLTVLTLDGQKILFSIETGERISTKSSEQNLEYAQTSCGGVSLILGLVALTFSSLNRKNG